MPEDTKNQPAKNFLWGASVSAYQVEGGNHNQWSIWELENADYLGRNAEKHYAWLPNWNAIKAQAQDPNNYINDGADDHYSRYEEDFDLAGEIGLNAFRFGVEWSRIEPTEGQWNQAEIDRYKRYISQLKKRGIQPVITLWHWTMPVWFARKGGFAKKKNIQDFVRFVDKIAADLIEPCGWVLTVNEPNSYVGMSYLDGQWPPEKHSPRQAVLVTRNLARAHRQIYSMLKKRSPHLQIGVATQCTNNQPKRPNNPFDRLVAATANYYWNWWFLNMIKRHQDFVGFNYYFTDYYHGLARRNPHRHMRHHRIHTGHRGLHRSRVHNPPSPINDLGWYMEPASIYKVIMQVKKRYNSPILVTETGTADANDAFRQWWLSETLAGVEKANAEGANVVGYFVWSLLDNFEWSQGFWPRFGLVEVDREQGLKRTMRPSAKWLSRRIGSSNVSK